MNKNIIILFFIFFLAPLLLQGADVKSVYAAKQAKPEVSSQSQDAGYLSNEYPGIQSPKAVSPPEILPTIINLLVALGFTLLLVYLLAWAFKYFNIRASIPIKSKNVISVIAKEYIDGKSILYVVEFAGKVLLLGNAGQSINLLTEITDNETIEKIKQQADEYVAKYRLKTESRFDQELKSSYLQQGKKLVNSGNEMIKGIMTKLGKKDKK
jgi:flagellar biogenesis protein FliO